MSPEQDLPATLIWATRGRSWGFRFLFNGGLSDPLADYERIFAGLRDEPTICRRVAGKVALRFPDPLRRRDSAGRLIPHDFVVPGNLADEIESVEDGLQKVWPLVAEAYSRVWAAEDPPSAADLRLTAVGTALLDDPSSADDNGERADPG